MIISGTGMFRHGIAEMTRSDRAAQIIRAVLALMILAAAQPFASQAKSAYSPPQAAMVVDGYSGEILYSSNADEPRYPASITKVMTIYLLFEQIRDGHMTFKTQLKVSAEAASRPPSKLGLKAGSTISAPGPRLFRDASPRAGSLNRNSGMKLSAMPSEHARNTFCQESTRR
jgi:D-alanyl-D-alanine carboxypeptidase